VRSTRKDFVRRRANGNGKLHAVMLPYTKQAQTLATGSPVLNTRYSLILFQRNRVA
jgi:hypothetical protein